MRLIGLTERSEGGRIASGLWCQEGRAVGERAPAAGRQTDRELDTIGESFEWILSDLETVRRDLQLDDGAMDGRLGSFLAS